MIESLSHPGYLSSEIIDCLTLVLQSQEPMVKVCAALLVALQPHPLPESIARLITSFKEDNGYLLDLAKKELSYQSQLSHEAIEEVINVLRDKETKYHRELALECCSIHALINPSGQTCTHVIDRNKQRLKSGILKMLAQQTH